MALATAKTHINLPTHQTWQIIGNPLKIEDNHPAIYKVEYIQKQRPEPGARMRWFFRAGKREGHFEEKLVIREEGQRIVFENRGGQNMPPFKFARTSFEVSADGEASRVQVTVNFALGGIARLFQRAAVKRYEAEVLPALLAGLKAHCEAAGDAGD